MLQYIYRGNKQTIRQGCKHEGSLLVLQVRKQEEKTHVN